MFFALYWCICLVYEVIVCFVFRILYLLAGWEGVGSILHYLAPASLSWGGGGPASQEESVFALRMRSESKKHNSYEKGINKNKLF